MYNITHFYFHNTDKISFFRMHNRNKHSDPINRTTLTEAYETSDYGSGIEFSIHHNLTLSGVKV